MIRRSTEHGMTSTLQLDVCRDFQNIDWLVASREDSIHVIEEREEKLYSEITTDGSADPFVGHLSDKHN